MTRKRLAMLASVGVIALIIAGCGSGGGGSSSSSAAPAASSGAGLSAASTSLGKIVVGPSGRTLYLFSKDSGKKSNCAGACASNWPPYTASSKPSASGISAGSISLVKRADGAKQVTLDGHPLYYFAGDQAAGQLNGQGVNAFGAKWFTVAPSGTSVTGTAKSTSKSSGGGSSSSGGGYAY